jgi:integrase
MLESARLPPLQDVFYSAQTETKILWDWLQRRKPPRVKAEMVALCRRRKAHETNKKKTRPEKKGKETAMIYKRGKVYWYKFVWQGRLMRESTKQGNDKVARQMEAAHRVSLAKGEVGLRDKKPPITLGQFIDNRFEPWAKGRFEKTSPKTWFDWYRVGLRAIKAYKPLANAKLDEITSERIAGFAAKRQTENRQVSTVNSSLRVLGRVLRLAVEWGDLDTVPKVRMLSGERRRERVVSRGDEARYLAAAPELVGTMAAVLVDTGLRPDECFRLCWEAITWLNGRRGTLIVTHGKTAAARRVLPMTPRVRNILEARWKAAGKPDDGWVWPAPTRSGHVESCSLKKQHAKTFKTLAEHAAKNNLKPVRPFVLYSLRHTFLTRLGESGCDVWTLARIAGHSSIRISSRYVHPSEDVVLSAMARLGRHKSGHNEESPQLPAAQQEQVTQ